MNEMAEYKKCQTRRMTDAPGYSSSNELKGGREVGLASSVMECGNSLALISIGKRLDGGTHCAQLK